MPTLLQNGRNHVSKDLKFQNFPGEDAPEPPYWGAAFNCTTSPKNLDPHQSTGPDKMLGRGISCDG